MAAGFELAIGTSCKNDRDVFGGVGISITDAGAKEDHRVVEKVGVPLGDGFHALKHVGVLLGVPGVDLLILVELFAIIFVMGNGVVTSADAIEEGEVLS